MTSIGNIVQMEDYFKAIKDTGPTNAQSLEEQYFQQQEMETSRNRYTHHIDSSKQEDNENYDNITDSEEDISIISDTFDSINNLGFQSIQKQPPKTHKLVLSRQKIQLTLIHTQSFEEQFKIMNRNQFKLQIKTRFRDPVKGIHLISPSIIDKFSSETFTLSIDEVEEIGDIFNSIILQVFSECYYQTIQIPVTVRYQRPRIRLQYQGSTCFLSCSNGRHPQITLKASIFKQYMINISSSHKMDITLETPMTESSVFPDELMVGNERRKITIRTNTKCFCLVARIKQTQLAFVCKVSLVD